MAEELAGGRRSASCSVESARGRSKPSNAPVVSGSGTQDRGAARRTPTPDGRRRAAVRSGGTIGAGTAAARSARVRGPAASSQAARSSARPAVLAGCDDDRDAPVRAGRPGSRRARRRRGPRSAGGSPPGGRSRRVGREDVQAPGEEARLGRGLAIGGTAERHATIGERRRRSEDRARLGRARTVGHGPHGHGGRTVPIVTSARPPGTIPRSGAPGGEGTAAEPSGQTRRLDLRPGQAIPRTILRRRRPTQADGLVQPQGRRTDGARRAHSQVRERAPHAATRRMRPHGRRPCFSRLFPFGPGGPASAARRRRPPRRSGRRRPARRRSGRSPRRGPRG